MVVVPAASAQVGAELDVLEGAALQGMVLKCTQCRWCKVEVSANGVVVGSMVVDARCVSQECLEGLGLVWAQ